MLQTNVIVCLDFSFCKFSTIFSNVDSNSFLILKKIKPTQQKIQTNVNTPSPPALKMQNIISISKSKKTI